MGVYYHFFNRTTQEPNTKPLFEGSRITWIAKFNGDREEFKYVIKVNGWKDTDVVRASSDDYSGHYYEYRNGRVFSGCADLFDQEGDGDDEDDQDEEEVLPEEEEVVPEEEEEKQE